MTGDYTIHPSHDPVSAADLSLNRDWLCNRCDAHDEGLAQPCSAKEAGMEAKNSAASLARYYLRRGVDDLGAGEIDRLLRMVAGE